MTREINQDGSLAKNDVVSYPKKCFGCGSAIYGLDTPFGGSSALDIEVTRFGHITVCHTKTRGGGLWAYHPKKSCLSSALQHLHELRLCVGCGKVAKGPICPCCSRVLENSESVARKLDELRRNQRALEEERELKAACLIADRIIGKYWVSEHRDATSAHELARRARDYVVQKIEAAREDGFRQGRSLLLGIRDGTLKLYDTFDLGPQRGGE